jgi:hypothetical protein
MEKSILIRDTDVAITDILEMISRGLSYYQILLSDSRLTLSDIMVTAKIAQELISEMVTPNSTITVEGAIEVTAHGGRIKNLSRIRQEHPRAFEPWSQDEERQLVEMFHAGKDVSDMARALQRKQGAITARLKKLELVGDKSDESKGNTAT